MESAGPRSQSLGPWVSWPPSCLLLSEAQHLCPANEANHSFLGYNCFFPYKQGLGGGVRVWVGLGLGLLLRDRTPGGYYPPLSSIPPHFTAGERGPKSKDSAKVASTSAAGGEPKLGSASLGFSPAGAAPAVPGAAGGDRKSVV